MKNKIFSAILLTAFALCSHSSFAMTTGASQNASSQAKTSQAKNRKANTKNLRKAPKPTLTQKLKYNLKKLITNKYCAIAIPAAISLISTFKFGLMPTIKTGTFLTLASLVSIFAIPAIQKPEKKDSFFGKIHSFCSWLRDKIIANAYKKGLTALQFFKESISKPENTHSQEHENGSENSLTKLTLNDKSGVKPKNKRKKPSITVKIAGKVDSLLASLGNIS